MLTGVELVAIKRGVLYFCSGLNGKSKNRVESRLVGGYKKDLTEARIWKR